MVLKKGYFFTMDALLGLFILVTGLILLSNVYISTQPRTQLNYYSEDIISLFSDLKVNEIDNPYLIELITDGTITDMDTTIIEQIGIFWVTNRTDIATALAQNLSYDLIPERFGFSFVVGDDVVYEKPVTRNRELVTYKNMISGIEKSRPVKGTAARIFLSSLVEGIRYEYLYFGGFVGQGHVTRFTTNIPADAWTIGLEMRLSAGDNFTLYINGDKCDDFFVSSTNMTADYWSIDYCNDSIVAGSMNNFTITFEDPSLDNAYIAGGYIRIDYQTKEVFWDDVNSDTYYFPGINGIANLYSSFSVPGQLNSINAYVHFKSNYSTYLSIGENIVFNVSGDGTDQTVTLTDADFSSAPISLDYDKLSNTTVPIRFASFNKTLTSIFVSGDADVVLITDMSGSMKNAVGDWSLGNAGGTINNCPNYYADNSIRKSYVAQCSDAVVNDVIINYTGNRLWPVWINKGKIEWFDNPENHNAIENNIDSYSQGKDQTCIACAINQAYDILDTYSNENRSKFVILMSDGIPTHCALGSCTSTSTLFGAEQCDGLCDNSGACDIPNLPTMCNDCITFDDATKNAIYAANRTVQDLNATFYTVGFGPVHNCSQAPYFLGVIANLSNGTFQMSDDFSDLIDIYRNISFEILKHSNLISQTVISPSGISPSVLYEDSYIEFNFTPVIDPIVFGEVPLFFQSRNFDDCSETFHLPNGIRLIDTKVISFSGPHWTDYLSVQNSNGTHEVFNLSKYLNFYEYLGDPFVITIKPDLIATGDNNIFTLRTGDDPYNSTGCSRNNSFIYTALINIINSSLPYSEVLPNATGCNWTIELDTGINITLNVPGTYSGASNCYYTNTSHDGSGHNTLDSYDVAMFNFLRFIDNNDDGRIFLDFNEEDLSIGSRVVLDVPYLWGPTIAEVRVWQ